MQYRMEEKPGFRVVGYREVVGTVNGENFVKIPKMWDEFPKARYEALHTLADAQHAGIFGVIDMKDAAETFDYWIAVSSERTDLADWMASLEIPRQTYAIFDTPLANLQDVTRRIFAEWLPSSGYEHADGPELEYYPDGDMSDPAAYRTEIWIPVVRKEA